MKNIKNTSFISGSILVIAVMGANIVNFVFNAFLGRALSFEELGIITFINTLFYVSNIFYNALSLVVNHQAASVSNKEKDMKSDQFLKEITKRSLGINTVLTIIWLIATPFIANFFHITNFTIVYLFSLVIIFYPTAYMNRGYLQGKFLFFATAITIIMEPIIKLISAVVLMYGHQESMVYLSVYISSLGTALLAAVIVIMKKSKGKNTQKEKFQFPKKFYFGALMTGLSTISFLALDVILVKHFINPKLAGQYALLSLIGKIIYFLGSLLNVFTISLVGKDEGQNKNPLISFYKLFIGSVILGAIGYIFLGVLGSQIVPLLFGKKAFALLPYLNMYCLTILLFTLGNTIVTFHLAKKQYVFPAAALVMSVLMVIGIWIYHQNIQQIIHLIFTISIISTSILILLHIKYRNKYEKNVVSLENVITQEIYE